MYMQVENKYIRFDWAVKRMLRDKANFAVLEGLITVLLGEKIVITELLESQMLHFQSESAYCDALTAYFSALRKFQDFNK